VMAVADDHIGGFDESPLQVVVGLFPEGHRDGVTMRP
jgi:hypothetical protein